MISFCNFQNIRVSSWFIGPTQPMHNLVFPWVYIYQVLYGINHNVRYIHIILMADFYIFVLGQVEAISFPKLFLILQYVLGYISLAMLVNTRINLFVMGSCYMQMSQKRW